MSRTLQTRWSPVKAPIVSAANLPILYEDEGQEDMGEANLHYIWTQILFWGARPHFAGQPTFQVFGNLNLYYAEGPLHPKTKSRPYISPDVMVVEPFVRLPESLTSYTMGVDGPAPRQVTEVLSERSAQQRDLKEKLDIYAGLGVSEYILADPTGRFLAERLLLKRLLPNGVWKDEKDEDGGITSQLQFRVILESENMIRVMNAATGRRYVRPEEAEQRVRDLEAEVERLRAAVERDAGMKSAGESKP